MSILANGLRPDLPPWRTSPNPDPEPVSIHTRGLAAAAAPLNLPARPAGMSLVQWIGIIQAILATIQPFLQPQGGPAK